MTICFPCSYRLMALMITGMHEYEMYLEFESKLEQLLTSSLLMTFYGLTIVTHLCVLFPQPSSLLLSPVFVLIKELFEQLPFCFGSETEQNLFCFIYLFIFPLDIISF